MQCSVYSHCNLTKVFEVMDAARVRCIDVHDPMDVSDLQCERVDLAMIV
jgi:hypothetical protein